MQDQHVSQEPQIQQHTLTRTRTHTYTHIYSHIKASEHDSSDRVSFFPVGKQSHSLTVFIFHLFASTHIDECKLIWIPLKKNSIKIFKQGRERVRHATGIPTYPKFNWFEPNVDHGLGYWLTSTRDCWYKTQEELNPREERHGLSHTNTLFWDKLAQITYNALIIEFIIKSCMCLRKERIKHYTLYIP